MKPRLLGAACLSLISLSLNTSAAIYEGIDCSPHYQLKRITVKLGASLSLQMHHHRAEHWIVVTGTAKVTKGDEVFVLSEKQSTYIPPGCGTQVGEPGERPL